MRYTLSILIIFTLLFSSCQQEEKPLYYTYETFEEIAPLFEKQTDSIYVINFWATWCKPCIEEMPYFEQIHEDFKKEKVKVILVSMDFKRDVETRVIPFLEERQLKPEVALLLDGKYNNWIGEVEDTWDGVIPVTLVYRDSERLFHGKQFANYAQLEAMVKTLLE